MYAPLTQVRVQNFQSIEDEMLKLGQLTVLVGEGDAGKSAYLRAIRAAFLNEGDDLDIRKNADDVVQKDAQGHQRCTVTLTFEDGVIIAWWKDLKKGGCYLVTDTAGVRNWGGNQEPGLIIEFTKTAGEVPEEIAEYLGIVQLEVDANTILTPQLSDQHDQPWLLWETGSKRARIIGKATRLDMIVSAQLTADRELRQHNKEVANAQAAIEAADFELTALGSPESWAETAALQSTALEGIVSGARIAARARELLHQFEEADSRAQVINVFSVVAALNNVAFGAGCVIQLRELENRFLAVDGTTEVLRAQGLEATGNLGAMKATYTEECTAAGVCEKCGGLLDHEECK